MVLIRLLIKQMKSFVHSDRASPYEVTELVAKQGQPKQESDRGMVHQVPQGISSYAAKKHKNRARGD